jgi:hypothetical protein
MVGRSNKSVLEVAGGYGDSLTAGFCDKAPGETKKTMVEADG